MNGQLEGLIREPNPGGEICCVYNNLGGHCSAQVDATRRDSAFSCVYNNLDGLISDPVRSNIFGTLAEATACDLAAGRQTRRWQAQQTLDLPA
jgi:hypothetical protein